MTNEQLQKFCSKDETRPGITQPFTDGEWTYATDGRMMIRVPVTEPVPWRESQPKNAYTLIPDRAGMTPCELPPGWQARELPMRDCKECDGDGKDRIECDECKGECVIECSECGHSEDCEKCDGTGDMPGTGSCEDCNGTGKVEGKFPVPVNRECSVCVDLKYLRLAHELPGVKLFYRSGNGPLRIEFDGGDGCLMPVWNHFGLYDSAHDQWK
jgi:hypothetical protein